MALLRTRDIRAVRAFLGGSTLATIALAEEISKGRVWQLIVRAFRLMQESPHCIRNERIRDALLGIRCARTAQWRALLLSDDQEAVQDAISILHMGVCDALSGRAGNCLRNMGVKPTGITRESVRALLQSETFVIPKNMGRVTYDELVGWVGLTHDAAFQETRRTHWAKKFHMAEAAKKTRCKGVGIYHRQ